MFDHELAIKRIRDQSCPCDGCPGDLTSSQLSRGGWGFCRACRCAWQVSNIDGHDYATTIPSEMQAAGTWSARK